MIGATRLATIHKLAHIVEASFSLSLVVVSVQLSRCMDFGALMHMHTHTYTLQLPPRAGEPKQKQPQLVSSSLRACRWTCLTPFATMVWPQIGLAPIGAPLAGRLRPRSGTPERPAGQRPTRLHAMAHEL